jgi:golgi to ER traffic protein 4
MPAPSLKRTLASIQSLTESGEYYAAHQVGPQTQDRTEHGYPHAVPRQKYRTSAARLLKAPPSTETLPFDSKAQEAVELLWDGARSLLEKGQLGSGTDLGLYLIDVWNTRGVVCGNDERGK